MIYSPTKKQQVSLGSPLMQSRWGLWRMVACWVRGEWKCEFCSLPAVWFEASDCEVCNCLQVEAKTPRSPWQVSPPLTLGADLRQTGIRAPYIARHRALTWFLYEIHCGCLCVLALTLLLSPRKQLPSPASIHPSQAMFLPGLQWDPRPASHHVQEALLPLDLWVWTSVFTHLCTTVCCLQPVHRSCVVPKILW